MRIGQLYLNDEELIIGAVYGLLTLPVTGEATPIVSCLTAFLWALTGSDSKYNWKFWRRWMCPILVVSPYILVTRNYLFLIVMAIHIATLHLGYGLPDKRLTSLDDGSLLGRFWWHTWNGDNRLADIFTRGTIYLILILSMIPIWITYAN